MAYRLKFSRRALHQVGKAREWYESQQQNLGEEFISTLEFQFKRLEQTPMLYQEVLPRIRRAVLPRFPYLVFYTIQSEVVHVISIWHQHSSPAHWP